MASTQDLYKGWVKVGLMTGTMFKACLQDPYPTPTLKPK